MSKSIMEPAGNSTCYECGCYASSGYMHEHHVFGGSNRKKSEHFGLKVHLCYVCHLDSEKGVHGNNLELRDKLHRDGQKAFEEMHGTREEQKTIKNCEVKICRKITNGTSFRFLMKSREV